MQARTRTLGTVAVVLLVTLGQVEERAVAVIAPSQLITKAIPSRSGLTWASGVYTPGNSAARVEAFAAWRGRPVDVVVDWSTRQTWSDIVAPTWLYQAWAGTPYTKVLGVAPIPEGNGSTLARCAAGNYDGYWVAFGRNIQAAGLAGTTIIRLGWEFNGSWYKWKATKPATFAACWRRIYRAAESTAPALRWDWTVNRGVGKAVADARKAYPGNKYVDYVGVDSYDVWPGATSKATWLKQYSGKYGLKFWADFAKAHGKKLSVPEWGCYPGTQNAGHNGGDNTYYIAKMHAFFHDLGSRMAYEAYFNDSASYYRGSLYAPKQVPKAATRYRNAYKIPS